MAKKYRNHKLHEYVNELSSKTPVPGGGSASALVGALAASLLGMSMRFSLGKKRLLPFKNDISRAISKAVIFREKFLSFVDDDAAAFASGDFKVSFEVPCRVCLLAHDGLKLCVSMLGKCSQSIITDLADAAVFFESAFSGAYYNAFINLKFMPRNAKCAQKWRKLKELKKKMLAMRVKTEGRIGTVIGR